MYKTNMLSILPLDNKLMLQDDQIAFALLILHQRLELRTECVKKVVILWLDLFQREEPDPLQARYNTVTLGLTREGAQLLDSSNESAGGISVNA